jgi:hypothetical protein
MSNKLFKDCFRRYTVEQHQEIGVIVGRFWEAVVVGKL